ncbi:mRNA-binding protein PUF2, putative [Hepatocystis sp. ex Piliocolobus tephrosceles]|nr:mRNA-binding protein PUF2, putative [Hepatocystis sp. ex Piliocolobus tephrosceles]
MMYYENDKNAKRRVTTEDSALKKKNEHEKNMYEYSKKYESNSIDSINESFYSNSFINKSFYFLNEDLDETNTNKVADFNKCQVSNENNNKSVEINQYNQLNLNNEFLVGGGVKVSTSEIRSREIEEYLSKTQNIYNINKESQCILPSKFSTKYKTDIEEYNKITEKGDIENKRFQVIRDIFYLCFHKEGYGYVINKLKNSDNQEDTNIVFEALLIDVLALCTDIYGYYVAQSVYDINCEYYKHKFTDCYLKHTAILAKHIYGCRLIQKSLECVSEKYKCKIFKKLQGDLIVFILDQNGNHVIQKCMEVLSKNYIHIILKIIDKNITSLSSNVYGCRVIQRIYTHGTKENIYRLNKRIINNLFLIRNRYGNYVIQKCFEYSEDPVRIIIVNDVISNIYLYGTHKYACNIIEKILLTEETEYKNKILKKIVIDILNGKDKLIDLCNNCYGNFMVQKLLTEFNGEGRNIIEAFIVKNINRLKGDEYGKYILRTLKL